MIKRILYKLCMRCLGKPTVLPHKLPYVKMDYVQSILQKWVAEGGYATILAPWPGDDSIDPNDGYIQRIRMIDERVFHNIKRIYLYNSPYWSARSIGAYDTGNSKVLYLIFNDSSKSQTAVIQRIIANASVCYVHSIYRLLPAVRTLKPIWRLDSNQLNVPLMLDLHGAVAAELEMYGVSIERVRRAKEVEKEWLQKAAVCIGVTQAMLEQLEKQNQVRIRQGMIVPISGGCQGEDNIEKPTDRCTILYSGGMQKWQLVDETLSAIEHTSLPNVQYDFCVNSVSSFADELEKHSGIKQVQYGKYSKEELINHYRNAHYGFILRSPSLVNRVACPTKLIEYIHYGLIPIMKFAELGDFCDMGMQHISLEDFLNGRLPNHQKRIEMQSANLSILQQLNEQREQGIAELNKVVHGFFLVPKDEKSPMPH